MVKLLIWDFDGTLAHRSGLWSGTLLEVLDREIPSHTVQIEQLRPALQTGFRWHKPEQVYRVVTPDEWWAELMPTFKQAYLNAGLDALAAEYLAQLVQAQYTDLQSWEVYPDTETTLEELSLKGWTHVVLTNHIPEFRTLLNDLGLSRHFAQIFNSAETGFEKPHQTAFKNVLNAYGKAQQICVIGDSTNADIAGAQGVEIPALLVRKKDEQTKWNCADLSGVPALLNAIFS